VKPAEARKERNEARTDFEQATAALKKARKRFEHTERQYQAVVASANSQRDTQAWFDRGMRILNDRGYEWGVEWYVCLRKALHITEADALQAVSMPGAQELSPYICIYCTGWHVGHAPKYGTGITPSKNKIAARIGEKLKRGMKI
jgi:hypothetical protein